MQRVRVFLIACSVLASACGASGGSEADPSAGEGKPKRSVVSTSTESSVAVVTGSSSPAPTTVAATTTTVPPPPPIRSLDLNSARVDVDCLDQHVTGVTLNGSNGVVSMARDGDPVYGDLDGDGAEDAVVPAICFWTEGGNATDSVVVVLSSTTGGLRQLGTALEGWSPAIVGRTLGVRVEQGDWATPPVAKAMPYQFIGGAWVLGGGTPIRTSDPLLTDGVGSLRIGATYAEIAAATGSTVTAEDPFGEGGDENCREVTFDPAPAAVSRGLGDGLRLRMLYVHDASMSSKSGLHVGSTVAEVQSTLDVTTAPHEYGGTFHAFTDSAGNAMVFDSRASTVDLIKLGERDWAVNMIEGCL